MAIQAPTRKPPRDRTKILTYDAYMAEDVVRRRNDIIDGVRIYMAGPTWNHQRIQTNVLIAFREYERASDIGYALGAPFDVLLSRNPLRTRQPDALFISKEQLDRGAVSLPRVQSRSVPS